MNYGEVEEFESEDQEEEDQTYDNGESQMDAYNMHQMQAAQKL